MRLFCRLCVAGRLHNINAKRVPGTVLGTNYHDRDDGRQAQGQSPRAPPRPGKHVFVAYKNPFIFAVFECTN